MKGILLAKLAWLRRSPWTFILMTVMSVGFALVIGGSNVDNIKVPVYSELEEESFIVQQLKIMILSHLNLLHQVKRKFLRK